MIERACISINAVCNMSCSYCHLQNHINTNDSKDYEFSSEEVRSAMQAIIKYVEEKSIQKFVLGIVGTGEPMLSFEAIQEIVSYVRNQEKSHLFKIYTISNGTLLSDKQIEFFYDNRDLIDLNVSLDGDEIFHNLGRGHFDGIMKNITRFESRFGRKPTINTVVTRRTIENADRIIDFFCKNNFLKVNFSIFFGSHMSDLNISREQYNNFIRLCADRGIQSRQNQTGEKRKVDCAKYGNRCGVGTTNVFITKMGIYPCSRFVGMESYRLGTYNDDWSLVEMRLKMITPVAGDECYYDKMIERKV